MWRTVFANNRIQRSSTSSSMDLINDSSLEHYLKLNCDTEQQQCKIKSSNSFRIKNRKQFFEKPFDKQQLLKTQQQKQQLEQDLLTLKSTLIESKKKLTKKLNTKFRQQSAPNDKIKRRIYEQFECAIILNDCTKMAMLFKEHPKINLSHELRPDGNTLIHTAIRHQCKDALSWLASRCTRSQLNHQNSVGESPLHLAVREQSPILVNILLNHKACNHVQNYVSKETPLILALNLYIKYRNLKDYDCAPHRISEQFTDGRTEKKPSTTAYAVDANRLSSISCVNELDQHRLLMEINSCFCQNEEEKSFGLLQLERTGLHNTKFDLQKQHQQQEKENDSNPNRLISQPVRNASRNLNRLDDLTAAFLNQQNQQTNCCTLSTNISETRQSNRSEIETLNNCRLMRKILVAILHDSDAMSWKIPNSKGQTVITIAKQHQVDFVNDFISNYQNLAIKSEQVHQIGRIDQNGNYLSTAFDVFYPTNELVQFNNIALQTCTDGSVQVNATAIGVKTRTCFRSIKLQGEKVDEENEEETKCDERTSTTFMDRTSSSIATKTSSQSSHTNGIAECTSIGDVGARKLVSYDKRKTGEQEQYFGSKEQRSSKQDFNKSAMCNNTTPVNPIDRLFFRKSNRSHSITLGNNNLERDHLFTSSCSLSKLNELDNLDHQLKLFGNLLESKQQQQQGSIDRNSRQRVIEFAKQQQQLISNASSLTTKQHFLNRSTHAKTPLAIFQ